MKRRILVSAVLAVLLLAALAANVHAAEVKITASDGAVCDNFGAHDPAGGGRGDRIINEPVKQFINMRS